MRHYCNRTYRPRIEMIVAAGRQILGARVRALRETAGLTQENLAQAAGLGRITLVRLEKGKHTSKVSTLKALAAAFERPLKTSSPARTASKQRTHSRRPGSK